MIKLIIGVAGAIAILGIGSPVLAGEDFNLEKYKQKTVDSILRLNEEVMPICNLEHVVYLSAYSATRKACMLHKETIRTNLSAIEKSNNSEEVFGLTNLLFKNIKQIYLMVGEDSQADLKYMEKMLGYGNSN